MKPIKASLPFRVSEVGQDADEHWFLKLDMGDHATKKPRAASQ